MRTAKEVYNIADGEHPWFCSYQPMLNEFGEIIIQVDDCDWQGDSRVLYKDAQGRYGWLQFGWGSCSGCDALQACDTINEVQELMENLQEGIKWFETDKEALEFFETHDWEGDYSSWNSEKQTEFVKAVIEHLKG